MESKLNLGCGQFPKIGYVNIDIDPRSKADVTWDLELIPYPFSDQQFEIIEAHHVLEHLSNPIAVMGELHRILKPNGILTVRTPHFSRGFTHWDHKRGFDVTFPYYFDPKFPGYTGIHFQSIRTKLVWFAQPYLKKMTLSLFSYYAGKLAGHVFDLVGNLNLFFTSNPCFLCWGLRRG